MHDEAKHQATVVGAKGSKSVSEVGGVTLTEAAGGAAEAGASAQIEGAEASGQGGGVDPGAARRDFESVQEEIEAVDSADLITVRLDPQKVAALILSILWRDSAPGRREAFERFAERGYYDISLLERVVHYARAVWYLRRQQQRALFVASGAPVSEEDRVAAFGLRARLIVELEFHCFDLPGVNAELEHLRRGAGHQDLANDLETLAELCGRDDVQSALNVSPKFRPSDPAEALRLADLLLRSLGMGERGEAERLTGLLQRATTLLLRSYEKHTVRGKFLFHDLEDIEATYPSLYAVARAPRRKRPSDEPAGDDGEGEVQGLLVWRRPAAPLRLDRRAAKNAARSPGRGSRPARRQRAPPAAGRARPVARRGVLCGATTFLGIVEWRSLSPLIRPDLGLSLFAHALRRHALERRREKKPELHELGKWHIPPPTF